MKKSRIKYIVSLICLIVTLVSSVGAGAVPSESIQSNRQTKIDPYVIEELARSPQTNVFVKMVGEADLAQADQLSDRAQRLEYVYVTLTTFANSHQGKITQFLKKQGITFRSYWINNSLYLYNVNQTLVDLLAKRKDVAYIRGDHQVPLHLPVTQQESAAWTEAVEWNVQQINADEVWAAGITGEGIVVATIDTGVRFTHEALVEHYRGNLGNGIFQHDYNWFDPVMNLPAPADNSGHGTHTMGTMVGGDGPGPFSEDIGVAPGATWIAAKGCGLLFCSDFRLIESAQWVLCPTRVDGSDPDCSKAPHVVNNSWGGSGGDAWYQTYIRAWLMAGIAPVFSIGNSGPDCSTTGSPGDYNLVVGIGATNIDDVLSTFSSKGPGDYRWLKPDFVAPGENVRSAISIGDNTYAVLSGTSMAAPHVSGTIALLLSVDPDLGPLQLYNALRSTTVTTLGVPPAPITCGDISYDVFPNPIYGWGRIDAKTAVEAILP